MDNPFSWDYLTAIPGTNEVFGPFAIGFLILFGFGFVASIIVSSGGARRLIKHPVTHRMVRRWSGWATAIFGIGLFFFLIRVLQINPFNFQMRIWLWLSLLAFVLLVGYCALDYRLNHAIAVQEYEERKLQRQYLRSTTGWSSKPLDGGAPIAAGPRPVKRRRR